MRQGCEKGWFAHEWIHAKLQRSHAFLPVAAKQIRSLFDNLGSEPPLCGGKMYILTSRQGKCSKSVSDSEI